MPTYSYRCTQCGNAFDIQQKFTDDTLTECPSCQGALRKVFSAVGVTFNGSGFYRTDSRASGSGFRLRLRLEGVEGRDGRRVVHSRLDRLGLRRIVLGRLRLVVGLLRVGILRLRLLGVGLRLRLLGLLLLQALVLRVGVLLLFLLGPPLPRERARLRAPHSARRQKRNRS